MRIVRNNNYYNKMSHSLFMIICTLIVGVLLLIYLLHDYDSHFRFSAKSGFYDDSFELKILGNKDYDVYYTIDGSEPTTSSTKYTEPILISDRTPEPNEYSNRYDISTGYYSDEIAAYSYSEGDPGYVLPQYAVDKCTVVRASIFDEEGERVNEISGVYFVGSEKKEKYDDIMIVSIATAPNNLFDYYDGIYVTGEDFDDYLWLCDKVGYDQFWWSSYWSMWPANYRLRGIKSEREARIDIFDNHQNLILSQTSGIRVQGDGSRGKLPRNLKLFSREEYSGSRYFQTDVFGNKNDLHKYVLFGGSDDNIYKIKDYLANTMESELNFATMDFKPCVCFLEGEYWGTYYLTEYYDKDYIQSHYDVPRNDVVIWKEGEISEGEQYEKKLYSDMESFISKNDMSIKENYEKACELIDINSFIDYYAAQIFIGRAGDWPGGNEAAWRSKNASINSKYRDGKWRWMLFDVNSTGLDLTGVDDDTITSTAKNSRLFASLIKNESFKRQFCERMIYIENNIYSEENIEKFINKYYEEMLTPLCWSNQRYYGDERKDEIISNAEDVKSFLLERRKYIDKSIREHFGEEYLEQ